MNNSVMPADTFMVVNKTVLNDNDRTILTMLYQPLIGAIAINLYYTLWSYLDELKLISVEYSTNVILNSMMISIGEFNDARVKLEGIGLVKTYVKKGNTNGYIFELYSPMTANDFLNNPVLSIALYSNVGKISYQDIISYFKIPNINTSNYIDITSKFSDVFAFGEGLVINDIMSNIKTRNTNGLEIISDIDIPSILEMIPSDILNKRSVTKDIKDYIYKIAYVYNYNNDNMSELIRNSISEKHTIDKELLKENASKYYSFENFGKLPSIIYKNQPEILRSTNLNTSKRSKMIRLFETTSPYYFLQSKYKNASPTASDLSIVVYLLTDLNLNPGVVNVLIDYVLRINDNKLTKAFVTTIASQWAKCHIETVEEAMNIAEKEYHKRKESKDYTNNKKNKMAHKPDWFDKEISEQKATEEEIALLEARLNRKE